MLKAKKSFRDIIIGAGKKGEDILIHPPIEYHWHLPPLRKHKGSFSSSSSSSPSFSLRAMWDYPLKLSRSFRLRKSPSVRNILEGSRNPKDEEIVESFREMLFLEGHLSDKQYDYHTLLRFLRMRDFNQIKAKDLFLSYLKWREEFGVDALTKEFQYEEFRAVKECYPHGYHGVDRYGRPVYIERVGMVDVNTLLENTTIERYAKYHVCEQEKTLHWRYPACSLAAKKHIASTTSILDVKNVGTSNFSKPARYLFLEIQKIDSNYYPETLNQLFIINAGSGFKVLWTAIKTFLEPRTLAKIKVLGSNYLSTLVEAIDPSNLPTFLGGTCTCSDSGGCLLSDKGPWNDPEITRMLQSMIAGEEESEGREKRGLASEDRDDYVQVKDILYDATSPAEPRETRVRDQPSLEKMRAFEHLLGEAKSKIGTLEVALEETKSVLHGLTQLMEDLKR